MALIQTFTNLPYQISVAEKDEWSREREDLPS